MESVLTGCGTAEEAILIVLLISVGAFRTQLAFFVFVCWSVLSDAAMYIVRVHYPSYFFQTYEIQLVIDSAMMFAVLVELAWGVLRPVRSSLPKRAWMVIAFMVAVAGLLLWPVAGLTLPVRLAPEGIDLFRLQQTFALLRIVIFLAMAAFSQLLSIGWRSRELQVATGLGFYSLVSLAVTLLHTHQRSETASYHLLDELGAMSYLAALGYWLYAFATKEAERRAFTPQMEHFLLAAAGGIRSNRIALSSTKPMGKRDE